LPGGKALLLFAFLAVLSGVDVSAQQVESIEGEVLAGGDPYDDLFAVRLWWAF